MTANDKQIERAAVHIMTTAIEHAVRTAAVLNQGHVQQSFDSWCAQTRHMAFQYQGSNSHAEPMIARTKVLLALLGFAVE